MPRWTFTFLFYAASCVAGQQVGTQTAEVHPTLSIQQCWPWGCLDESAQVVLDASSRYADTADGRACTVDDHWNLNVCIDPVTCSNVCGLEGADYAGVYGVTTGSGVPGEPRRALQLNFLTHHPLGQNIGSRVLVTTSDTLYKDFNLHNAEIAFDVDTSNLPCGINAAAYLVGMDLDGRISQGPANHAGTKYGTGYCDASCPQNVRWIDGVANLWPDAATAGDYSCCCSEVDLWLGNAEAFTTRTHPCTGSTQYSCQSGSCYDFCDPDGCDIGPDALGNPAFYGGESSNTIDTSLKFTVLTQFITDDGTAEGTLTEIRRSYVQNGQTYAISSGSGYDSLEDGTCSSIRSLELGGLSQLGQSLRHGMVLAFAIGDTPGDLDGGCLEPDMSPDFIAQYEPASVIFKNVRYGAIGSTIW